MKHYLELIPISARIQRKKSRMTRICILLAVFLVTAIFSMADMEMRTQKIQTIHDYGSWHVVLRHLSQTETARIAARPEVQAASPYAVRNYRLEEAYQIAGRSVTICSFAEDFLQMFPAGAITEGTFCSVPNAAVLTENAKEQLGIQLGDVVQLTCPDGRQLSLTISGFSQNTASLSQADALGLFLSAETYQKLPASSEEESIFYVQFSPLCNIQKTVDTLRQQFQLSDTQISENTKLLTLLLQSRDPSMMKFYLAAAILSGLVMIAGILMIASSLNSNVAQRIQFFGLLRCLGATEKQIVRFVRWEALNWCKGAIPLGIAAAVMVSWLLCALLRFLSPNLFSGMPIFAVSWPAVLISVVIGLVTVLLAAHAPARRAARVSPCTAVSGNAQQLPPIHAAANTRFFSVPVALGIHHATASKKNFFLIVSSFAFSIILFLAFSATIDFMHHAITPLRPYTPDISIISTDNTCAIPKQLAEQISQEPAVKQAYGRSFAYRLPVQIAGTAHTVNLISYDSQQLQWAKAELLNGSLLEISQGKSLLLVYDDENPFTPGDTVTFQTADGLRQIPIGATISTCPFQREPGVETMICSEALFAQLTGQDNYTILDLQLTRQASDADVAQLRALARTAFQVSDKRMSNREAKGAYYAMALFLYGFLTVILLISVFSIINTMSMSVSSRLQQYGIMRAIGMCDCQVLRMLAAEAGTYTLWGIILGCVIGLPINRLLFTSLVTTHWGDVWTIPVNCMLCIIFTVMIATLLAIWNPARQIKRQAIVETIRAL